MGRPDGQLCDKNFEIFAENLSCLRAASKWWVIVVQTVTRLLQVISLLSLCAFGPWGWPSERLIFYMQFPYLLYARPDHGRPASGRLSLNCELALRSSASGRESTSSGRLQQSSYIYFWKENLKLDRSLRVVWTGCWVVRTDASWNRSFSIQRSIQTEIHVVQTDDALVCRASGRYGTSSGRLELWTDERPDEMTRCSDGWQGTEISDLQTVQNLLKHFWIAKSLLKSIFTYKWFCPIRM
jgi:hypothetical protein